MQSKKLKIIAIDELEDTKRLIIDLGKQQGKIFNAFLDKHKIKDEDAADLLFDYCYNGLEFGHTKANLRLHGVDIKRVE